MQASAVDSYERSLAKYPLIGFLYATTIEDVGALEAGFSDKLDMHEDLLSGR